MSGGRRSLVVGAGGWCVVAMAVAGLAGGLLLGWRELVVIGLVGAVVALAAAAFLFGRAAVRVDIAVLDRDVVAGTAARVAVRVQNDSSRRRRPGAAELQVGDRVEQIALPPLDAGESRDIVVTVATTRRGVITLGPVTIVRRDPLALARRDTVRSQTAELFVHPATAPLALRAPGLLRDLEGVATTDPADSDMSFHALRSYVAGDDRRHIHWKSTAKTGTFLVRQFDQTRRSHLIVLQSLAAEDYASPDEFELAVSVVASIGVRALADGTALSVFAGPPVRARGETRKGSTGARRAASVASRSAGSAGPGGSAGSAGSAGPAGSAGSAGPAGSTGSTRRVRSRTPQQLLDDLSGVEPTPSSPTLAAAARAVAETAPDASAVFLAAGSPVTARALRAAAAHFAAGVDVLAVVAEPESHATLVRIDTLRITRIGYLDDLSRTLARAAGA